MLNSFATLAAEPASIIYIVTGVVGMMLAGRRKAKTTPVSMLICSRESRALVGSVELL